MRLQYENDRPIVPIRVLGETSHELKAHIDFAASKTIIPSYLSDELHLPFRGYVYAATGGGVITMAEYEATVEAFGERHGLHVGCLELPEEAGIAALLGRDILDKYRVCLDGKRREVEISDP
jgi:hypothetical protein